MSECADSRLRRGGHETASSVQATANELFAGNRYRSIRRMNRPPSPATTVPAPVASAPARRGWNEFTAAQVGVLFLALVMVAAIPIFTHPLPPLEDYINHLARMHVIATVNTDPDLAKFYEIDWQVIPNLMMDLIVPKLARIMNIYVAGQVFTIATFVLILSGVLVLNRVLFRRWSVLPLVAAPLLYNYVFLIGVMNYMFGIGLAMWGLAAWILLRDRLWPIRLVVSAVFVLGMFFCHLFAVGLYGMGLLAFEILRLWGRRERPLSLRILRFRRDRPALRAHHPAPDDEPDHGTFRR